MRLGEVDENGVRSSLDRLLDQLGKQLRELAAGVSHKYLVHAGPSQQMSKFFPA